jgi:hypothetical protein
VLGFAQQAGIGAPGDPAAGRAFVEAAAAAGATPTRAGGGVAGDGGARERTRSRDRRWEARGGGKTSVDCARKDRALFGRHEAERGRDREGIAGRAREGREAAVSQATWQRRRPNRMSYQD